MDIQRARIHGDTMAAGAKLDFAVNVQPITPPWLQQALQAQVGSLAAYPSAAALQEATAQLAACWNLPADHVLLVSGAAEGFHLLGNLAPTRAVTIHPTFTEPDVVFASFGIPTTRVATTGRHTLDEPVIPLSDQPALKPAQPQPLATVVDHHTMVVVGNPTNPTGVLHRRDTLQQLAHSAHYCVVDEAFQDACDDTETLLGDVTSIDGLIVLRSFTKGYGIAGLRLGAMVAAPQILEALTSRRPHWSLGTFQIAAAHAIAEHMHTTGEHNPWHNLASAREDMRAKLVAAGFEDLSPHSVAPYLWMVPPTNDPAGLAQQLAAEARIAVRTCDSFFGVNRPSWRLAVRPAAQVATLIQAVHRCCL
ncbi:aminotransferase class I/II-fold pyridoxal phosphate-dependent enzyme [Corynebacterium choanae]|uniref:Aminotransferase n=1 Tax=Corynebacterium choanae TaxID=1862358 RepID=A0A3G6J8B3_9CORY|nr:aminotransferase class I/II-fold pyridoxal phosphate-dependent enzyme [Corynebacterium choanae]AZA14013.1 Threonine-phosphate decarboxylase [Corynebacterium choanae]